MNPQILYGPGQGEMYGWPPAYDMEWPPAPFAYTYRPPVRCGPINDPYCPSRQGVLGLPDSMGFPTCCCRASGKCHTPTIVPLGDPPYGIVTWPMGPWAYLPRQLHPPFW